MLCARASRGCGDEGDGRSQEGSHGKWRINVTVEAVGEEREVMRITEEFELSLLSQFQEKERCELTGS